MDLCGCANETQCATNEYGATKGCPNSIRYLTRYNRDVDRCDSAALMQARGVDESAGKNNVCNNVYSGFLRDEPAFKARKVTESGRRLSAAVS